MVNPICEILVLNWSDLKPSSARTDRIMWYFQRFWQFYFPISYDRSSLCCKKAKLRTKEWAIDGFRRIFLKRWSENFVRKERACNGSFILQWKMFIWEVLFQSKKRFFFHQKFFILQVYIKFRVNSKNCKEVIERETAWEKGQMGRGSWWIVLERWSLEGNFFIEGKWKLK